MMAERQMTVEEATKYWKLRQLYDFCKGIAGNCHTKGRVRRNSYEIGCWAADTAKGLRAKAEGRTTSIDLF